jgi:hypothetical protein
LAAREAVRVRGAGLAWDLLALFWGEVETESGEGGDFIIGRWDGTRSGDIWVGSWVSFSEWYA